MRWGTRARLATPPAEAIRAALTILASADTLARAGFTRADAQAGCRDAALLILAEAVAVPC